MSCEDEDWDRVPTALEIAHYNSLLERSESAEARAAKAEADRKRIIFGECLLKLVKMGIPEAKGRSMLGKWRGQAKDDALLVRIVAQAHSNGTPDPISYITKALRAAASRAASVSDMSKSKWVLLGWEKPRMTAKGAQWRNAVRGQVWRDPFGNVRVLATQEGTVPPTVEDDPGVDVEVSK